MQFYPNEWNYGYLPPLLYIDVDERGHRLRAESPVTNSPRAAPQGATLSNYSCELFNLTGTVRKVELVSTFTTAVCESWNVSDKYTWDNTGDLKARSHDPFLRIRFLLVPKNGSCERIKNDLPSNGSVILKTRMEIEHALFSPDTLLER